MFTSTSPNAILKYVKMVPLIMCNGLKIYNIVYIHSKFIQYITYIIFTCFSKEKISLHVIYSTEVLGNNAFNAEVTLKSEVVIPNCRRNFFLM